MATKTPVTPKLAATILLLRDADNRLEVFMVERHHQIDFATGAMVFPGGKADPGDVEGALRAHCRGTGDLDDDALTVRIAAIRETFEECGVLLARPAGAGANTERSTADQPLVGRERLRDLETRYRQPLQAGDISIRTLVETESLELACDLLVPFAHWITPEFMPKRFDTHFFLVPAPPDQLALHDGEESVDSVWTTPADALEAAASGRRTIIFPTLVNVRKLGRSADVAEALARARTEPVVTVLPQTTRGPDGKSVLNLPPEAGYEVLPGDLGKMP